MITGDVKKTNNVIRCDSLKIIDFGMSRKKQDGGKSKNTLIPIRWSAPELFGHENETVYSFKSDIW